MDDCKPVERDLLVRGGQRRWHRLDELDLHDNCAPPEYRQQLLLRDRRVPEARRNMTNVLWRVRLALLCTDKYSAMQSTWPPTRARGTGHDRNRAGPRRYPEEGTGRPPQPVVPPRRHRRPPRQLRRHRIRPGAG